jgi:hypothetical protein
MPRFHDRGRAAYDGGTLRWQERRPAALGFGSRLVRFVEIVLIRQGDLCEGFS